MTDAVFLRWWWPCVQRFIHPAPTNLMGCVFLFFFCHYLIFSSPPPPLWCLQSCARLAEERGGVRESGPKRSEGRVKQKQGEAGGGRRISTNYKAGDQEEEKHEESHFEEELKPICEVGWVTVRTNNHQTVSLMLTRGWRELLKCVSASQWQWKGWTMLQPVTAWESGGAVKRLNIRLVGRHYSSVVVRVGGGWEVGGGTLSQCELNTTAVHITCERVTNLSISRSHQS